MGIKVLGFEMERFCRERESGCLGECLEREGEIDGQGKVKGPRLMIKHN